ncbi:UTRA domain-containing protein [Oceanicella sp. SM1341]|uniref:UTRA domain-containing protein n=1 Tax=Oceanicella sp. SM1341 TaxID=1548889 RepID=UPI001E636459|nr:UTRA domain-containing protein [Oceanicella sp. SM1341]
MASFRDIKEDILARISAREWAPGDLIPNEAELAERYGSARSTVNRALRELAEAGLLERRRRAGTRVARRNWRGAFFEIPLVRAEVEGSGRRYGYHLIERREEGAGPEAAARLELPAGAPVLFLRCLHFADGLPHQLETRWINRSEVPGAAAMPFEAEGPNEWLVREVPWSSSEHVFSAAMPDAEERRLLGMEAGEPLFVLERRTWSATATITWARLAHPGARFRMVSRTDPTG